VDVSGTSIPVTGTSTVAGAAGALELELRMW
jgi:hypothetical protein